MTIEFDFVGNTRQEAAAALIAAQAAGISLPEPVITAIRGVTTSHEAAEAARAVVATVSATAATRLEEEIRAEVEAAAGRGEALDDPFAPVRALEDRRASAGAEALAARRSWSSWSTAFWTAVIDERETIAATLAGALADVIAAARPLARTIGDLPFDTDGEALFRAPKPVGAAFDAARPLAARQDVLREAAWGLVTFLRPLPGESRPHATAEWQAMAERFRGGGLVIDEARSWTRDPATDEPTIEHTWFHGCAWSPEGHPVRRLLEAEASVLAGAA